MSDIKKTKFVMTFEEKKRPECKLIYVTPHLSNLVEYAGRTCYMSFDKMTDKSYEGFIKGIVLSGHESVIEHSNLIFILMKPTHDKSKNIFYSELFEIISLNGLIRCDETLDCYIISGNIRMFKDLIRGAKSCGTLYSKNTIIEDILKELYTLPKYFFQDFINNGIMDVEMFRKSNLCKETSEPLEITKINDYLSIVNIDSISDIVIKNIRVRGMYGGVYDYKMSDKILNRHRRITMILNEPRYISHQEVRHRMASYSQQSQRYVKFNNCDFYVPPTLSGESLDIVNDALAKSKETYCDLIARGVKAEDARVVLPNAVMSQIVITRTLDYTLNYYLKERCSDRAQEFIRDKIARPLKEYLELNL